MARRLVLCAVLAVSTATLAVGRADAYPDRLIKVVVPYPAGGPIDVTARLVVQRLGPILGQTVIVENRGGAGGALGSKAVAAADPDGYTLLFGNASRSEERRVGKEGGYGVGWGGGRSRAW